MTGESSFVVINILYMRWFFFLHASCLSQDVIHPFYSIMTIKCKWPIIQIGWWHNLAFSRTAYSYSSCWSVGSTAYRCLNTVQKTVSVEALMNWCLASRGERYGCLMWWDCSRQCYSFPKLMIIYATMIVGQKKKKNSKHPKFIYLSQLVLHNLPKLAKQNHNCDHYYSLSKL